ncbi:1-phosphatidylinositol 4,5-bisphosphate phosphodiesterase delta-4 [Ceratocystis fimbriata CBS 114723]|uniref:Phosphoinositide phospholipase C n=1 Tax=Ceratocystis fimbriata CBS 114723 TaxID=1035309 RepID=A0A2C5WPV9_9PEZI|nr:1-phosphatidylinositol 4,5-bisphosphate phosphodiesterase delta-4 [Ceratocystis fimbriata CBS 114723]
MLSDSIPPSLPHFELVQVPSSASSSRPSTQAESTFTSSFTTTNTSCDSSPSISPELKPTVCSEEKDVLSIAPLSEAPRLNGHSPVSSPKPSPSPPSMASLTPVPSTTSSAASSSSSAARFQAPPPYPSYQTCTTYCHAVSAKNQPEQNKLIRRFSNRTKTFRSRNSSVPASSRETSLGPALARNASGRASSPHLNRSVTDKDSCYPSDTEDSISDPEAIYENPGEPSKFSSVYPQHLVEGVSAHKVSKKRRKKVSFSADPQSGAIIYVGESKKRRVIPIDSIDQVRYGSDTDQYRTELGATPADADVWLTLICSMEKSRTKIIHMVFLNAKTLNEWALTLASIMRHREQEMVLLMSFNERAVADIWIKEAASLGVTDTNELEVFALPFDNIEKLCRVLHIHVPRRQLFVYFELCDTEKAANITYHQFRELLDLIRAQNPVSYIYREVITDPEKQKLGMTRPEFFDFIRNCQRERVDGPFEKYWNGVFKTYATTRQNSLRFTEISMYNFLRSKHNVTLKKPEPAKMDQPMNRYFISSSHNTYLLGRQIAGSSSVEGYISALIGGCRCVEIDCWDGPNGTPQVLHGRTLTSAVSFESCITSINKWAFYASPYPLWISLEVHTNPTQQARMVQIMKDIFGPLLVTEPLDPMSHTLPSPEELMGRIIIKVKKPVVKDDHRQGIDIKTRRRGNSLTSSSPSHPLGEITMTPSHSMPPSPVLQPVGRAKTMPMSGRGLDIGSYYNLSHESDSSSETSTENKTVKVLGDLGVYCTGVKFRGFESPEAKAFNHIFSFKEDSFEKCSRTKDLKRAMETHNRNYLMRVYPSQFRVTSNNFDPIVYWRRGVQMAALNWQTFDLGMQLNRAMFSGGNDGTGYVLKPPSLLQQEIPSHTQPPNHHERKEISMTLNVISVQQLICPPGVRVMNPYVEIEVFHASDPRYKTNADYLVKEDMVATQKHRTRIISDNGYDPRFQTAFQIELTTRHEELVFIRFSVKLSPDTNSYPTKETAPIAVYMAKMINLNNGYRLLPLWDRKGAQFLFSNIICHIRLNYIRPITVISESPQIENRSGLRKVFGRSGNNSTATSPRSTTEKE